MNQFKKAKQKALQSGHQVENITDLQTAGVKQPIEEKKQQDDPKKVSKEVIVEQTPVINPEPVAPVTPSTPVVEPQSTVVQQPIVETPIIETPIVETQMLETPVIPEAIQVTPETPVVIENQVVNAPEPVVEETIPERVIAQVPAPEPVPVPVRIAPTPVVQEVTYTTPVATPVVNTSKAATTKKSIPNIFAPKNEAKSMRKSLVLKPTSVKIAENYCAKNGGSFNELIQTLLDNFIDEYGL